MTGVPNLPLGPGREFDGLRAIFERLKMSGLGDDCAVIPFGGTNLVVSIDLSVEGVHFRTDWLDFASIGARATAAALSDLAADGATPLGVLVSLGVPGLGDRGAGLGDPGPDIMGGVAECAASVGAMVLGGDLVRSEQYLVDVAVIGTAERPVRRRGARPGDGLWVTGILGGPGLALSALRSGQSPDPAARQRFARPEPRITAGRWLAAHGATAMIDISDGLAADAAHVAVASGVALEIELERLPCWDGVEPLAAAASGEEFELLVTLPEAFGHDAARDFRLATALNLTRIGACAAGAGGGGRGGVRLTLGGRPVAPPRGYDHFAP